jgi:hypothetical protein
MPNQCISPPANLQASLVVARRKTERYALAVAANSAAGFGDPSYLAHKRPIRQQALFLCPPFRVMAAVRGRPSGLPGSKFPVRQPAHSCHPNSFGDDQWQLHLKLGALPMRTTNPSKIRAAAHRAMARAALHANSSLRSRLARYNSHMEKARALEATGGVK